MRKKKGSAEVSIDPSCPPPTFEDYHRFTMLDPQSKYKGHEGYVVRNWFPASTMPFVVNKLGQLEDIEDKLGIDLITLFKALKNGVYYRNAQKEINYAKNIRLSFAYKTLVVDYRTYKNLCDYGKTWALTKGELELL